MSNPHNMDPIYQDLKRDADLVKADIEKAKDEVDRLNGQFEKFTAENGDKRELVAALFEQKNKLEKSKEKLLYIEEKMREVVKSDAIKYKEAFKNDKPWPDPAEYAAYKLQKELEEAKNREWLAERRIKKLLHKKIDHGHVVDEASKEASH